mmetsp:Transcript_18984/g.33739  ORF Transcript_18984/g.33739 Transcript_18984/m.33739 type:complete len:336 (+) Transcript_18984:506-1513(+)
MPMFNLSCLINLADFAEVASSSSASTCTMSRGTSVANLSRHSRASTRYFLPASPAASIRLISLSRRLRASRRSFSVSGDAIISRAVAAALSWLSTSCNSLRRRSSRSCLYPARRVILFWNSCVVGEEAPNSRRNSLAVFRALAPSSIMPLSDNLILVRASTANSSCSWSSLSRPSNALNMDGSTGFSSMRGCRKDATAERFSALMRFRATKRFMAPFRAATVFFSSASRASGGAASGGMPRWAAAVTILYNATNPSSSGMGETVLAKKSNVFAPRTLSNSSARSFFSASVFFAFISLISDISNADRMARTCIPPPRGPLKMGARTLIFFSKSLRD